MSAAEAEEAAVTEASTLVASRSEPSTEKVTRGSMATLAPGQWLNNEVINFVGRILIAPRRSNTNSKAHVYSTYFMSRLLRGGPEGNEYDFHEVRNDDDRIPGGLADLEELYIPINVGNFHWIFIRVHMRSKTIELYDSMGKKESNDHYLEHTRRYIYDALHKHAGDDKPPFAVWSQAWATSDESHRSPLQDNGYDCGMFTLISIGLL